MTTGASTLLSHACICCRDQAAGEPDVAISILPSTDWIGRVSSLQRCPVSEAQQKSSWDYVQTRTKCFLRNCASQFIFGCNQPTRLPNAGIISKWFGVTGRSTAVPSVYRSTFGRIYDRCESLGANHLRPMRNRVHVRENVRVSCTLQGSLDW